MLASVNIAFLLSIHSCKYVDLAVSRASLISDAIVPPSHESSGAIGSFMLTTLTPSANAFNLASPSIAFTIAFKSVCAKPGTSNPCLFQLYTLIASSVVYSKPGSLFLSLLRTSGKALRRFFKSLAAI